MHWQFSLLLLFHSAFTFAQDNWTSPHTIETSVTLNDVSLSTPEIAADGSGNCTIAAATLIEPQFTSSRLPYSYSSDYGQTWTSVQPLGGISYNNASGLAIQPCIAAADSSGAGESVALAAWSSTKSLNGGSSCTTFSLHYSRSINGGSTWSTPMRVINLQGATETDTRPRIACAGYGRWMIVFESNRRATGQGSSGRQIFCVTSLDDGVSWSSPVLIAETSEHDYRPDVAFGHGRWIVTWGVGDVGASYAAYSGDDGATWAPIPSFPQIGAGYNIYGLVRRIATDGNGTWIYSHSYGASYLPWFTFTSGYSRRSADGGINWTNCISGGVSVGNAAYDPAAGWLYVCSADLYNSITSFTSRDGQVWSLWPGSTYGGTLTSIGSRRFGLTALRNRRVVAGLSVYDLHVTTTQLPFLTQCNGEWSLFQ